MSDVKEKILEFLKRNGERATGEIARHLGLPVGTVRWHLMRMHLDGLVELRKVTDRVWLWKIKQE